MSGRLCRSQCTSVQHIATESEESTLQYVRYVSDTGVTTLIVVDDIEVSRCNVRMCDLAAGILTPDYPPREWQPRQPPVTVLVFFPDLPS